MPHPIEIVFLQSTHGPIDRSWQPDSVERALHLLGIPTTRALVRNPRQLSTFLATARHKLIWPTAYTLGRSPDGPLFVDLLDQAGAFHVAWPAQSLRLSSKIHLKQTLLAAHLPTPPFILATDRQTPAHLPFPYPAVVKAEFSTASRGIHVVHTPEDLIAALDHNRRAYRERSVIEAWRRAREFTVAIAGSPDRRLLAPIEIMLQGSESILTSTSKQDYRNLAFAPVEAPLRSEIVTTISRLLSACDLGDYARVDLLLDRTGQLHIIDINFIPGIDDDRAGTESFLPKALRLDRGITYQQTIALLLLPALGRYALLQPPPLAALIASLPPR